jgi:hypothetical protein
MALTLHPVPGKAKSDAICKAFAAGAPRDAQGHVFYGVTDANRAAWDAVSRQRSDQVYYFIDNSYFDKVRGAQFRVTKNGLQHKGFGTSDCKRFDALGIEIHPWRKPTGLRMLQLGQSPGFMRLMASKPMWLIDRTAKLMETVPWTEINGRVWHRNKKDAGRTLHQDLVKTDLLITHSSAAAVEAVLAGVCVDTSAASAAYHYAMQMQGIVKAQAWGCLDSLIPDRRQWAGVLADAQFTIDEMKDGTAWHMLHRSTP